MVNHISYSSILNIIAQSLKPNLDYALQLFQEVKIAKFLDSHIYSNLMHVIALSIPVDIQLAKAVFNEASNGQFLDSVIFSNTMLALLNSDPVDETLAISLYQKARELNLTNAILATKTLKILSLSENPNFTQIIAITLDCINKKQLDAMLFSQLTQIINQHGFSSLPLLSCIFSHLNDFKEFINKSNTSIHDVFAHPRWKEYFSMYSLLSQSNSTLLHHVQSQFFEIAESRPMLQI